MLSQADDMLSRGRAMLRDAGAEMGDGLEWSIMARSAKREVHMIVKTEVWQSPEGAWYERVGDTWYPWDKRPLCSCTVEDDGDGETGPHLSVVEPDPECVRCIALGRDELVELSAHPAFAPYMR
jgi:hypothetical protein